MIDLRSDTQTRPSAGMRAAMAAAEVGDEQRREDPTVLALEARAAAFLGQEEAVYLPTATMANQIALAILGERGSELLVEETAHIMVSELGGAAVHSGLQTRGLPGERGRLSPEQVRAAIPPPDPLHRPRASLLALENTHNSAGGAVWPLAELAAVVETARELGLSRPPRRRAARERRGRARGPGGPSSASSFDTVTLCLSKGLGCPLGARDRRLRRADGARPGREAPLRRRDAPGRDRRRRRPLRARAQRRAPRRRPRPGARRSPRAGPSAASRSTSTRVETNFVQVDVGALGLTLDRGDRAARQRPASA